MFHDRDPFLQELNAVRKKREKDRLNNLIDKLNDEQKKQKDHVDKVLARLRSEKDSWFLFKGKAAKNDTITSCLQLCLFPRCVFTASDAIYCANFVLVIHMLKTPNFSTLLCFDRVSKGPNDFDSLIISGLFQIFCDITYTVTSCTENEAHRYGRFLNALLKIVMRWHASKDIFAKVVLDSFRIKSHSMMAAFQECMGFPGFVTKFKKGASNDGGDDHVDYENYRHLCHKWHYKITKALVTCLESKDYVQIRNALTVLFKILPCFPVIANLANVMEKRIEKVR